MERPAKLSQSRRTHFSPDFNVIVAFAAGQPDAKWAILERLADVVLSGRQVHPDIQRVANAIVAQAVLEKKLPERKVGRRTADPFPRHEVAYRYFELIDGGVPKKEAIEVVHQEHRFAERQIRNFIREYQPIIGCSTEARNDYRAWRESCEAFQKNYEASVRMELRISKELSPVPANLKNKLASAEQALQSIRHELLSVTSGSN